MGAGETRAQVGREHTNSFSKVNPNRVNWSGKAYESQQRRKSAGFTRSKLSAGRQTTRWFTLIKSAICWNCLHIPGCMSHSTADVTNYQLFWKLNLSGLDHEGASESLLLRSSSRQVLHLGRHHICSSECLPEGASYTWSSVLLFLALIFVLQYCSKWKYHKVNDVWGIFLLGVNWSHDGFRWTRWSKDNFR